MQIISDSNNMKSYRRVKTQEFVYIHKNTHKIKYNITPFPAKNNYLIFEQKKKEFKLKKQQKT